MKMMTLAAAGACALGGFAGTASAQVYGDTARVVAATPVYERVSVPRRECHVEQVSAYEERRTERIEPPRTEGGIGPGTVLGAVIGGVVGHQFGGSSAGRDHGTAAGAVVGGLIGNQVDRDSSPASRDVVVERAPVTREVERCNTIADARDEIVGYDVRYEYNGHEFTTRLPYDPGPQLPVNVEVRPPEVRGPIPGPRTPRYRGTY
jgi:uncharacterized protein YcfJ